MPIGIKWFSISIVSKGRKTICLLSMLLILITFCVNDSWSQHTANYLEPEMTHRKALELFEQKNYGSARELFESIISVNNKISRESLLAEDASFYISNCSYHLNDESSLQQLYSFISDYPASRRINESYFLIGNLEFKDKKYKNALQAYSKVNPIAFSETENAEYLFKMGYSYFKLEDFEKAKDNLLPVSHSLSQYASDAIYYYSVIAAEQNNYDVALSGFQSLVYNEKYSEQANYYILQIHYHDNNFGKVTEMAPLIEPTLNSKSDLRIYFILGDSFQKTGKYKEAQPLLKNYVTKNSSKTKREEYYVYAFNLYRLQQYNDAIPFFQKAIAKQDSLAQSAYYFLGDCYNKTNQKNFAINAFESASQIKADPEIATESLFNSANLSLETGLNPYQQVIDQLRKFIIENPDSKRVSEANSLIVNILLSSKNYVEAIELIEASETNSGKLREVYPKLLYLRGLELFNQNKFSEAENSLNKARKASKTNNIEINFWLGECYFRQSRFSDAAEVFKSIVNLKNASDSKLYAMSHYNLGHVLMKQKNHSESITFFKKYTELGNYTDADLLHDSYQRLGDLFFLAKKYQTALSYYDQAVMMSSYKNDYPLFQKAICLGAMGNNTDKAKALENFLLKYPSVSLSDDACFEAGQTYLLLNREKDGLRYFERLVNLFPNSQFSSKALLKSGLIYYNLSQYELAIETLKKVVSAFPGSQEVGEALEILSNVYLDLNKVSEYTNYIKTLKNVSISETEQASLTFTAAENQFIAGKYDAAIEGYRTYIIQYPNGQQIENAHYYLAECLFKVNLKLESARAFIFFIDKPAGKFSEAALINSGKIFQSFRLFDSAMIVYERLELIASNEKSLEEAFKGQIFASFSLANYSKALAGTDKYARLSGISNESKTEILLLRGRSALMLNQNQVAEDAFSSVIGKGSIFQSAEAQYSLALINFNKGRIKESENQIYDLVKKYPSAEYWKARSFILLADILSKQGNYFQAKHTLQSIIDNYPDEEIVNIAREKLMKIEQLENQSN